MSRWIEVPAHRILAVEWAEFFEGYERIGHNGSIAEPGEVPAFILRKSDGRRFQRARYLPVSEMPDYSIEQVGHSDILLEEI